MQGLENSRCSELPLSPILCIGCLDTVDAYALDYDVLNGALTSVISDA
jgi:hypothetical protein